MNYTWEHLNHLQLGRYAEYLVKMELVRNGFDVYSSEVDDRGIDFIIRTNEYTYFDIQVKSVRNLNYIFLSKDKFKLRKNLVVVLVLFNEQEPPLMYLIPSLEWKNNLNSLLKSKDFEGKSSPPEWGINLSKKTVPHSQYKRLSHFNFF